MITVEQIKEIVKDIPKSELLTEEAAKYLAEYYSQLIWEIVRFSTKFYSEDFPREDNDSITSDDVSEAMAYFEKHGFDFVPNEIAEDVEKLYS